MQKRKCFFIFAIICSFFLKNAAYAASFGISPVRIIFSNTQNMTAFEIKNQGEDILILQLDLKSWEQQKSAERYSDTDKLLITPRMVSIAPHKSQVIRIALRNKERGSVEEDYRIFIREVIDRSKGSQENKGPLNFILEVNMPVFVMPNTKEVQNLEWKIENTSKKYSKSDR